VLVWVLKKVLRNHRNSLLGTQNNLISLSTRKLVQFYSARVIEVLDESKFDIMQSFLKITYHIGCFRCLHLSLPLSFQYVSPVPLYICPLSSIYSRD